MFYAYQILLLIILIILVTSKIKYEAWKVAFLLAANLFLILELAAVYLVGKFIDYQFYSHMNINAIEGHGFQFVTEFIVFSLLYIVLSAVVYRVSKIFRYSNIIKNKLFVTIVLVFSVLLNTPGGLLNELYGLYEITNVEDKNFSQALTDLGIMPEKYVTPNEVTAKKGKNIIVISIESLERGFLESEFDNVAPNLSELSKNWTYYDQMFSAPGGGWTAASLYNHQVGVPAFFSGQGNDYFQGVSDVKLTGLGHILNEAGYNSAYIVGNAEFAGMADILSAYKIPVVSDDNTIGDYPISHWGFNDYDLFQEAKLQVKKYNNNNGKPFAIFISTINSHFPGGIYDKRMEKFVPKRKDGIEFAVGAVDYLLNDFINFLKDQNLYGNTAIYIFPDHLLMGSGSSVHEKLKKSDRMLYLLTNIDEGYLPKKTTDKLYQIDLPRMIVSGSGITTNATFLSDYVNQENKADYIKKNKTKLSALNKASVTRANYKNGIDVKISGNELMVNSDSESRAFILNKKEDAEIFDIVFNEEMVMIGFVKNSLNDVFSPHAHDEKFKRMHLIIYVKNGEIDSTYLGNKQKIGVYKKGGVVEYTKNDIHLVTGSSNASFGPVKKEEIVKQVFHNDESVVSITSSEYKTSRSSIRSVIKTNDNEYRLSRGLNLLSIGSDDKYQVEYFDTWRSKEDADKFLIRIDSLIKDRKFWAVASNDAIKNTYPGYRERLEELNFKLLQKLNGAVAYIAYSDSANRIHEYSSKTSISYLVSSFREPLSDKMIESIRLSESKNNAVINNYGKDVNRFIAHAGGEIDGRKYTDSLDALNFNYKKGFRLFELDIIKTSDDVYVAAHDWGHWAKITGYKGDLPPDHKTFMSEKIYKKFSPLDMNTINKWFGEHPDAILVTDKINDPVDFSNKFIDKKRLMMELFTWDAVKNAINSGIRSAMPTWSIVNMINGNKVDYLKELGVTEIASSRQIIHSNKELLEKIVDSGVKIYAFEIKNDKDELYVACNESDYFYGMYADNWNFNDDLSCER
ncbi:MAG: sulfatase-like hydrolase/transferase [Gammaproteobacteria bacterium]|nr:sulfatase-like hydrolase/transferase [Gammaproteobacteria bacterium]